MRLQLSRKIKRIEEKLSAVAKRPEVIFVWPGDDIDEAIQQRYGDDIPADSEILIATFGSALNG